MTGSSMSPQGVDVGVDPAAAVDDQHRARPRRRVQPGGLGDRLPRPARPPSAARPPPPRPRAALTRGPAGTSRRPEALASSQSTCPLAGRVVPVSEVVAMLLTVSLRSVCGPGAPRLDGPAPRSAAPAGRERRHEAVQRGPARSAFPRRAGSRRPGRRRSSSRPSRSTTVPAIALAPVRVPVLARAMPAGGARAGRAEAVVQRAGQPGHRQPGDHLAQPGQRARGRPAPARRRGRGPAGPCRATGRWCPAS